MNLSLEQNIKEKLIKEFIDEFRRVPTQQEERSLYAQYITENVFVEEQGLTTRNLVRPISGEESSASMLSELEQDLLLDKDALIKEYKNQNEELEFLFRKTNNRYNNLLNSISKIEREVNKDLILHLDEDIYSYGMVEDFSDYEKVDFNRSNIYFYNNKMTVGYTKVASNSFDPEEISLSLDSRDGIVLGAIEQGSFNSILKEDGLFYKQIAKLKNPNDIVDFSITISFREPKEIQTLKFTSNTPQKNSKASYRVLVSENLSTYSEIFESSMRLKTSENYIEINRANLREIKIIISKKAYDYIDNKDYAYVFGLDFIGYVENKYKINQESVAYLGPYEIVDEANNPVNFTLAAVKKGTCCIIPDKTSIDLYVSKDDLEYKKVDFNLRDKEVVQFEEGSESLLDYNLFKKVEPDNGSFICLNPPPGVTLRKDEKLLNFYVPAGNQERLLTNTIVLKRNINTKDNLKLYNSNNGWYLDSDGFVHSYIEIISPEGKYIDFGPTSCFVDDRQVTGKVFLRKGIHKIRSSKEDWYDLDLDDEREIRSSKQLRNVDKLYPYNHKYLIEGFEYSGTFKGEKVYNNLNQNFSFLMREVSNQRFNISNDFEEYTLLKTEDGIYFKIYNKVDSSESKFENFDLTCRTNSSQENSNKLYIKAILKTFDEKVTPKIEQIQVRVI